MNLKYPSHAPRKAQELRIRRRCGIARLRANIVYPLFAMYFLAFAAQAKQGTISRATVKGTVFLRDSAGNESPVAAARVTLEGPATLQVETDPNGEYRIAAVPFGTYTVQVVFPSLEARETIQEAIEFLAAALVPSRYRAVSGKDRRTLGAGQ